MSDTPVLFDERTRRALEQVMLLTQRTRIGAAQGERRSVRRGTSIEFADYQDYAPGDDLRYLDWNFYARTGTPTITLFEDEEDLAVDLLLDTSASMGFPTPDADAPAATADAHKFTYARRLLAGLGVVSLASNDRLTISALAGHGTADVFGPVRGRSHNVALLSYVNRLRAAGPTDLNAALSAFASRARRAGLLILLSDLLAPGGIDAGLRALAGRGYDVAVLHLLAPEDLDPPLYGDLRLVDSETGHAQEVTIDAALLAAYRARALAWADDLRAACARRGARYLRVTTDAPWERVLLHDMRRQRLVR